MKKKKTYEDKLIKIQIGKFADMVRLSTKSFKPRFKKDIKAIIDEKLNNVFEYFWNNERKL